MRNKSSNMLVQKRKLSKCKDVCRTYNDIQFAYATLLEEDVTVTEFQCNVPLDGLELEGAYTTDFLITKTNGDIAIRECVFRDKISKPLTVKMIDASYRYWTARGFTDWGIVVNEETRPVQL